MFPSFRPVLLLVAALSVAGCVSMPNGPSVAVLPGTGKSFDQFRYDDGGCRQFAYEQIGGQTAQRAQENSAAASAVVGTAVGALAGAAFGGSQGAAVGAGVGLLGGSLAGSSTAYASGYEAQRRYDIAYQQCMYSKGHRVPVAGRAAPAATAYTPPPPSANPAYTPPPPPGAPPPPPPR